jgi:hypothetical protein
LIFKMAAAAIFDFRWSAGFDCNFAELLVGTVLW